MYFIWNDSHFSTSRRLGNAPNVMVLSQVQAHRETMWFPCLILKPARGKTADVTCAFCSWNLLIDTANIKLTAPSSFFNVDFKWPWLTFFHLFALHWSKPSSTREQIQSCYLLRAFEVKATKSTAKECFILNNCNCCFSLGFFFFDKESIL